MLQLTSVWHNIEIVNTDMVLILNKNKNIITNSISTNKGELIQPWKLTAVDS